MVVSGWFWWSSEPTWITVVSGWLLYLTKKQVVAWIQSFLEPVCRQRGVRGLARPTLGKRVSWNPAKVGEKWEEVEGNPFRMWWRRTSSQQSEKIVTIDNWIASKKWLVAFVM
jgi:hypothetical protein